MLRRFIDAIPAVLDAVLPRVLLAVLCLAPLPLSAQPANDDCANALPIGEGDHFFTTVGATTDGPTPCASIGSDVWLLYTPGCSGEATASTCGQVNYDSAIAVYPASAGCPPPAGTQLVCVDDTSGCGVSTVVSFPVVAGESVLIQLGGWTGQQGSGTLSVNCAPFLVSGLTCASPPGSGAADIAWTNDGDFDSANLYVDGDLVMTLLGPFNSGEPAFASIEPIALQQLVEVCVEPVVGGVAGLQACCEVAILAVPMAEECSFPGAPISDTLPVVEETLQLGAHPGVVADLQVDVDITHTWIGDLVVELESPGGTLVTLHDRLGGSADDLVVTWWEGGRPNGAPYACDCFMRSSGPGSLTDFTGETIEGSWMLRVIDAAGGDDGTLNRWCLRAFDVEPPVPPGPDILIGELNTLAQYGRLADEVGCAVDSPVCNVGEEPLDWFANPDPRHPFMVYNMYRELEGRFEQIGLSWVKHGFGAAQADACWLGCSPYPNSTRLGVGCSDTYGAALNGVQQNLGPRSEIDPWTGAFSYFGSHVDTHTGGHDEVEHRLRLLDADLDPAANPGALYFVELIVFAHDDADHTNSVGWELASVTGAPGGTWSFNIGATTTQIGPALEAWDGAVLTAIQTDPAEDGRAILGAKVSDNGDGTWRYEYALYNLDMARMVGSISVPVAQSVELAGIGFSAPEVETLEYGNDPWTWVRGDTSLTWSTEPFDVNPASNPLRWGTLFNFWFDADVAPVASEATIGIFLPGDPAQLSGPVAAPSPAVPPPPSFVRGDTNSDGLFDLADPIHALDFLFNQAAVLCEAALDLNADGLLDIADPIYGLGALFGGGPQPPPPHPDCGADPDPAGIPCDEFPGCP